MTCTHCGSTLHQSEACDGLGVNRKHDSDDPGLPCPFCLIEEFPPSPAAILDTNAIALEIKNVYDRAIHEVDRERYIDLREAGDIAVQDLADALAAMTATKDVITGQLLASRDLLTAALAERDEYARQVTLNRENWRMSTEYHDKRYYGICALLLATQAHEKALRMVLEELSHWQEPQSVAGTGDYEQGLLCGLEDVGYQTNGYNAMRYGYEAALGRVSEQIDGTISEALAAPVDGGLLDAVVKWLSGMGNSSLAEFPTTHAIRIQARELLIRITGKQP